MLHCMAVTKTLDVGKHLSLGACLVMPYNLSQCKSGHLPFCYISGNCILFWSSKEQYAYILFFFFLDF